MEAGPIPKPLWVFRWSPCEMLHLAPLFTREELEAWAKIHKFPEELARESPDAFLLCGFSELTTEGMIDAASF